MGMTIDEAIRRIDEHNYIHQSKEPRAIYISEALNVAIETMRKYQKIEEIVKNTQQLCSYGSAFIDIREVVEDGNND